MKRQSKIFQVKTYSTEIKKLLGGEGLYYAFGYVNEMTTAYRVFVFNPDTMKHKLMLKEDAQIELDYYMDEPVDDKTELKLMNLLQDHEFDV